jgi:glycerate-2-kinase
MITNFKQLARSDIRTDLLKIVEEGIKAALPENALRTRIKLEADRLLFDGHDIDLKGVRRLIIIGFGKASVHMAKVLEGMLGDKIDGGAVICPFKPKERLKRVEVLEGTHPIPTELNVRSTERLLKLVKGLTEEDLVLALISGGGSALLTRPPKGITVEEKGTTSKLLMQAGADIKELNAVRKHLSLVKGGQLVRAIWPARLISFIISDVVGDRLDTIASGPTVPDNTTYEEAYMVLKKRGVLEKVPKAVLEHIKAGMSGLRPETPKPGDAIFSKTLNFVVASNIESLKAMKKAATSLGYRSLILSGMVEGEAREVGKVIASILRTIAERREPLPPPSCIIMGGETTVKVRGNGIGGRNQELALSVALGIGGLRNVAFVSIGSDGIDGVSKAAGAIADGETIERAKRLGLNPEEFLMRNDSHSFFLKLHDAIFTGPTGTNVNDFMVGLTS